MEEDLINGNGNSADYLANAGDSYGANYTSYDTADNGAVSQGSGGTSVSSPGWFSSLTGIFGQAATAATPILQQAAQRASTSLTNPAPAAPTAGGTAVQSGSPTGSRSGTAMTYLPWIIGAAALGLVGILALRKK